MNGIIDFFKTLYRAWPALFVVLLVQVALITVIFVFTFTNVWPFAHDWLNSTPCPDDRSCQGLKAWTWWR
jgi:hypothetical protein